MTERRINKAAEKLRGLSLAELKDQEREQMDQLFRLKFQMKMGQTESLNKIRTLRRQVARLKTLGRQHQLGIVPAAPAAAAAPVAKAAPAAKAKSAKKKGAK